MTFFAATNLTLQPLVAKGSSMEMERPSSLFLGSPVNLVHVISFIYFFALGIALINIFHVLQLQCLPNGLRGRDPLEHKPGYVVPAGITGENMEDSRSQTKHVRDVY